MWEQCNYYTTRSSNTVISDIFKVSSIVVSCVLLSSLTQHLNLSPVRYWSSCQVRFESYTASSIGTDLNQFNGSSTTSAWTSIPRWTPAGACSARTTSVSVSSLLMVPSRNTVECINVLSTGGSWWLKWLFEVRGGVSFSFNLSRWTKACLILLLASLSNVFPKYTITHYI